MNDELRYAITLRQHYFYTFVWCQTAYKVMRCAHTRAHIDGDHVLRLNGTRCRHISIELIHKSSNVDIWNFICCLCGHQSSHSLLIMQFINWLKDSFAVGKCTAVSTGRHQISVKMIACVIVSIAMMNRTSSQMTECAFQEETELSHNFVLNGTTGSICSGPLLKHNNYS